MSPQIWSQSGRPSGTTVNSEYYLAQIPAYYAGMALELYLLGPGDTKPLAATLYVEIPTASGLTVTPFTYSAAGGTTGGANSASNSNSNSSTSNNSGADECRQHDQSLRRLLADHGGPDPDRVHGRSEGPAEDPLLDVRHRDSSDVIAWTAQILGNPVHLVVP